MVNMVQKKVVEHLTKKELEQTIRELNNSCKLRTRFVFIKAVLNGSKVSEACDFLQISEPTGHRWLDNYNEYGPEGLNTNYSNSGRPSKLSDFQLEELIKIIENEDYLSLERVHRIIKDRYGIDYTSPGIKYLLKKLNFNYGKPYQKYSKRPDNAEESLKKTLKR
jgi:putative transposase